MKLKIFEFIEDANLNDNERVLSWFLHYIYREAGDLNTHLTIDKRDLIRIWKANPNAPMKYFNGPLTKYFAIGIDTESNRAHIRITKYVKNILNNRKMPLRKGQMPKIKYTEVNNQSAINIAIYLSAVINHIPNIFIPDEEYSLDYDDDSLFDKRNHKYPQYATVDFIDFFEVKKHK